MNETTHKKSISKIMAIIQRDYEISAVAFLEIYHVMAILYIFSSEVPDKVMGEQYGKLLANDTWDPTLLQTTTMLHFRDNG
jgi:hypothetical protein